MNQPPEFNNNKLLSRWMLNSFYISLALAVVFFITAPALAFLVKNGLSQATTDHVSKFFSGILENPDVLFYQYSRWFKMTWSGHASGLWFWIPLLPFITIPVGLLIGFLTCPSRRRIRF